MPKIFHNHTIPVGIVTDVGYHQGGGEVLVEYYIDIKTAADHNEMRFEQLRTLEFLVQGLADTLEDGVVFTCIMDRTRICDSSQFTRLKLHGPITLWPRMIIGNLIHVFTSEMTANQLSIAYEMEMHIPRCLRLRRHCRRQAAAATVEAVDTIM